MNLVKIKYLIKCLLGKDLRLKARSGKKVDFLGSRYGGWSVHLAALPDKPVVYSCGIGEDASFDLALIDKIDCQVLAFDPTPKSLKWVESNIQDSRFKMHPWALSGEQGELKLWLPDNPEHVSASFAGSDKKTKNSFVAEAKTALGEPEEGHKYCLIVSGILDGDYTADNIKIAPIEEIIKTSGELGKKVKGLPNGAKIEL